MSNHFKISSGKVTIKAEAGGWDISNALVVNDESVVGTGFFPAGTSFPMDVFFNPDGLQFFIVDYGFLGANQIDAWSLSTAWDISTLSYSVSLTITDVESTPTGVFFKPDGSKMYVCGKENNRINQFSLSTPWNILTASLEDYYAVDSNPNSMYFNSDGSKVYVLRGTIYQYSLSTPWDITTTSYDDKSFSPLDQEASPSGVFLSDDGSKLYVTGFAHSEEGNDLVHQYSLSTPYDISTASYNNIFFSATNQIGSPQDIFLKPDGFTIYVVGPASVAQYSLRPSGYSGLIIK